MICIHQYIHPLLSISLLAMNFDELLLATLIGSPKWDKMGFNGFLMFFLIAFRWLFDGFLALACPGVFAAPPGCAQISAAPLRGWVEMGCPAELQVLVLPCNNDFPRDLISAVKNGDELQEEIGKQGNHDIYIYIMIIMWNPR